MHELHWSKYGSEYRSRAEEQRKRKLAEAHVGYHLYRARMPTALVYRVYST